MNSTIVETLMIRKRFGSIGRYLDRLVTRNITDMQVVLRMWMDTTIKVLRSDISRKFAKDITSELTDWKFIEEEGKKIIRPATLKIMQSGGNAAYKTLAMQGSFDVVNPLAVEAANKFTAKLVKDVTSQTKKAIRTHIADGVKRGVSMPNLGRELRSVVGLNQKQATAAINYRGWLQDKRPDLSDKLVEQRVQAYQRKQLRRRGVTIARTETARAQNIGYCQGLQEVGVSRVQFQIAPTDACDDCIALNESTYAPVEGQDVIPVHPGCRCAMLPVVDDLVVSDMQSKTPEALEPEPPKRYVSEEKWEESLSEATISTLDAYTSDATQIVNFQREISLGKRSIEGIMRTGTPGDKWYLENIGRIEAALDTAPGFKGEVWRGMVFEKAKGKNWLTVKKKFESGKPFAFDSLKSFSADQGVAQRFAAWDQPRPGQVKVMIHMKKAPKRSAYISELVDLPEEAEVLVGSNSKYRVTKTVAEMVGKETHVLYELAEVL